LNCVYINNINTTTNNNHWDTAPFRHGAGAAAPLAARLVAGGGAVAAVADVMVTSPKFALNDSHHPASTRQFEEKSACGTSTSWTCDGQEGQSGKNRWAVGADVKGN
jgi:hypothetical protein